MRGGLCRTCGGELTVFDREAEHCHSCGARLSKPQIASYRKKKAGLCVTSGCPYSPKPGHTMCQRHLTAMLVANQTRRRGLQAKGLCIEPGCGSNGVPALYGSIYCALHRQLRHKTRMGLTQAQRRALKAHRAKECEVAVAEKRDLAAQVLERAKGSLKPRTYAMIVLYYGLDGYPPLTLLEIGERYRITRERVRQIIKVFRPYAEELGVYKLRNGKAIQNLLPKEFKL